MCITLRELYFELPNYFKIGTKGRQFCQEHKLAILIAH